MCIMLHGVGARGCDGSMLQCTCSIFFLSAIPAYTQRCVGQWVLPSQSVKKVLQNANAASSNRLFVLKRLPVFKFSETVLKFTKDTVACNFIVHKATFDTSRVQTVVRENPKSGGP